MICVTIEQSYNRGWVAQITFESPGNMLLLLVVGSLYHRPRVLTLGDPLNVRVRCLQHIVVVFPARRLWLALLYHLELFERS